MVWLNANSLLRKIYNVNISTNLITQSEEFRFSWKLIRWQKCCAQYEPSVIPVALIKNSGHINEMPLLQIGPYSTHVCSVWTCIRLITWRSLHVVTCNKPVSSVWLGTAHMWGWRRSSSVLRSTWVRWVRLQNGLRFSCGCRTYW